MLALLPCALVVAGVALCTDLDTRTIPNGLTFPALAGGLALQAAIFGWPGLAMGLLGVVLGLLLMILPFAIGAMGAGDVKLLAALGAFLGPLGILVVVLLASVASGLISLAVALHRGAARRALRGVGRLARRPAKAGEVATVGRLPYAVPVALAVLIAGPVLQHLTR